MITNYYSSRNLTVQEAKNHAMRRPISRLWLRLRLRWSKVAGFNYVINSGVSLQIC